MFDKELVLDIISTIEDVLKTIQKRTESITSSSDFMHEAGRCGRKYKKYR